MPAFALGDRRIGMEVDLLVFQAAPPLDKNVVPAAAPRFREARLLPSMLIVVARSFRGPAKPSLVNWLPPRMAESLRGTEGSNPLPSSGESANLRGHSSKAGGR